MQQISWSSKIPPRHVVCLPVGLPDLFGLNRIYTRHTHSSCGVGSVGGRCKWSAGLPSLSSPGSLQRRESVGSFRSPYLSNIVIPFPFAVVPLPFSFKDLCQILLPYICPPFPHSPPRLASFRSLLAHLSRIHTVSYRTILQYVVVSNKLTKFFLAPRLIIPSL